MLENVFDPQLHLPDRCSIRDALFGAFRETAIDILAINDVHIGHGLEILIADLLKVTPLVVEHVQDIIKVDVTNQAVTVVFEDRPRQLLLETQIDIRVPAALKLVAGGNAACILAEA